MHPLTQELIYYSSTVNTEGLNRTMRKISNMDSIDEQKQVILGKNRAEYNAFHAVAGSKYYKEDPANGAAALNRVLNKACNVLNQEEYKDFCTSTTKKGYTPAHLAVRNGSYDAAVMVLQETKSIYKRANDENGFQQYTDRKNNLHQTIKDTYERNIKHSDIDSAPHKPHKALDKELYGEDYQRQQSTFGNRVLQSRQAVARSCS